MNVSDLSAPRRGQGALIPLLLALLVFVGLPAVLAGFDRGYFYQIANLALIFILLSASMHLVTGVAGLLHLGHAAFYGVGAYTAALLSTKFGLGFTVTLPLSGLVAALIAFLVALPTMRLVSIYFAVATLAIGQMLYLVMLNWVEFTKGPNGIIVTKGLELFGFSLSGRLATYYTVATVVALCVLAIGRLSHSYYGNALRSIREDDQCADAMGVSTARLKMEAFTLSAFFAGVAGSLWAHMTGYISPGDFKFSESILILAMVVVGGLGSLPGAVIGALLLILLPEGLRAFGDFRNIMVGLVMFLSILLLPKGLLGEVSALQLARRQLGAAWRNTVKGEGIGWR
ncbi:MULTISPECIES: branched-chain amino acid ABC transporter permease [Azospirillum]|uniref:Branched-chain amino acid ABC transporter permease n=3 Tax=Azospirillum TaxID=191 RepID=A0A5B0KZK7_9PROT|nr:MULTISPECIES: branched-chain amino acid ABC transporter permease [Azospirillum]KAA1057499.1 Branched-chain amino acid transport system permease protein LivM [Azospirillum argentinense]MDW7553187.1 branched-chain amino acid ABC transporter permease [Azospirillum brasilense]MDW7593435.1 branched-chain amino acid ABC transporter permease [Azospirillum brasilense]MDW7628506.1 branched-chain amino acid ABC transporter permease [Azospirillum brasilense]MDX5955399.1 branched-chain amino acid ABC t